MRKLIHDRDVSGDGSDDLSMTKQSIEKRSHALIALIASMHGFGGPRTMHTLFCAEIVRGVGGHERGGASQRPANQGFRKKFFASRMQDRFA
jgi:hypothetical protein